MKFKKLLGVYFIFVVLLLFSSCFNIFSIFSVGEPDKITDIDRLLDLGQSHINNMEYEKAYDTYERALELEPANSIALEGICTAYIFWKIPWTNIINAVINSAYSNVNFNTLFDVGAFVSEKLYKIVDKTSDGVIPYNDENLNFNFFFFNTIYGSFYMADTDDDHNVIMDTNDYFVIYPDFSFSNRIDEVTNTFMGAITLIHNMNSRIAMFTIIIEKSEYSLDILENSVSSTEAKGYISNLSVELLAVKNTLSSNISLSSNMNTLAQFGFTNNYDITNLFADNNYTNYDDFTNELAQSGITNMDDMTNYFEDLTNFNEIVSNYFNL